MHKGDQLEPIMGSVEYSDKRKARNSGFFESLEEV
nr:MAG TPA: hypothetical protein [Caudoviricetes sp.]